MTKEEHLLRLKNDPVYVVMGEALSLGRKNTEVAKILLDSGVKIIQYREKHKTWREKYAEASEIAVMCKKYGATFIMNDSVDLAVACGADGIHVGQDDAPVQIVKKIAGQNVFVGVSTNTTKELQGALADGADYVGFGPMFPTSSKSDADEVVTEETIRSALEFALPVVTIGGIGLENIRTLYDRGFRSFAMISAVVSQKDIKKAVDDLRQALK